MRYTVQEMVRTLANEAMPRVEFLEMRLRFQFRTSIPVRSFDRAERLAHQLMPGPFATFFGWGHHAADDR